MKNKCVIKLRAKRVFHLQWHGTGWFECEKYCAPWRTQWKADCILRCYDNFALMRPNAPISDGCVAVWLRHGRVRVRERVMVGGGAVSTCCKCKCCLAVYAALCTLTWLVGSQSWRGSFAACKLADCSSAANESNVAEGWNGGRGDACTGYYGPEVRLVE